MQAMALVVVASTKRDGTAKRGINKLSCDSKVVQSNQNDERSVGNSSRASTATGRSSRNKEYFFGEETLENKWKNRDGGLDDASSVSSIDDWVRSDSSVASSKYVDRVSLTVSNSLICNKVETSKY